MNLLLCLFWTPSSHKSNLARNLITFQKSYLNILIYQEIWGGIMIVDMMVNLSELFQFLQCVLSQFFRRYLQFSSGKVLNISKCLSKFPSCTLHMSRMNQIRHKFSFSFVEKKKMWNKILPRRVVWLAKKKREREREKKRKIHCNHISWLFEWTEPKRRWEMNDDEWNAEKTTQSKILGH